MVPKYIQVSVKIYTFKDILIFVCILNYGSNNEIVIIPTDKSRLFIYFSLIGIVIVFSDCLNNCKITL